jgi:ParB family chromosome partitioning protein
MEVDVEEISPNPYQPRTNFDPIKLQELADSIVEHGIIQPLVVSHQRDGGYELIAGERRLEAAKLAGLYKVPIVIRQVTEQNKAEWALIENIQRHNLNPIEEAQAYEKIQKEFKLTQEEIARKVGRSRSAVANILRLLKLPEEIKIALAAGKITEGHGRTILALPDEKKQLELFKSILKDGLNVRQVERLTGKVKIGKNYQRQNSIDPDLIDLENRMADYLKTKVKIRGIKNNGQIFIDYYSEEELGEIGKKLRGDYK